MQQIPQPETKQTGRWTKEEHQRFMYAIMQYGKDWKKVEQYVKTRSGSQVRSHAQKFFTKLQKGGNASHTNEQNSNQGFQLNRRQQQFSETQFDIEREMNNELTPSTPMQLVSLIKKQSRQQGGKISISQLKKTLQLHQQNRQKPTVARTEEKQILKNNSFKSMSNILSVYEQMNDKQNIQQDQSFFISITKKYKKLFRQVQDFDKLIDLHNVNQTPAEFTKNRKRSFTIPEGSDIADDEKDHKLEQIKKKINVDAKQGKQLKKQYSEKRQRRDSESSINFMIPPMNRLTTIQEQPEDELSYKAIVSQEALEDNKNEKK